MLRHDNYVIVVEHDLSVLDYLSDFVCCLYGEPGAYGVVTMPFTVREGINIFLAGFVPTENLRFRDEELTFRVSASEDTLDLAKQQALKGKSEKEKEALKRQNFSYPRMEKTLGPFHLVVEEGVFGASETVVMLGQNGTGKTTMIKMLAGLMKPDDESIKIPALNISYKPQTIAPKFEGQVQDLFNVKLKDIWTTSLFKTEVLGPLNIEPLLENDVQNLSGGEL